MKNYDKQHFDELFQQTLELLNKGLQKEAIENQLKLLSEDIVLITVVIKEASNKHHAELRKQGFLLVLIGCITGLSGFVITFFNFNTTRSIDFAMYGLTTLGLSIVFFGLYKIIG